MQKPSLAAGAAVFVKTIGRSPLKTRLAKDLGQERAHDFYKLSCQSIAEVLQTEPMGLKGYWAVAEGADAFIDWPSLKCLDQGLGGLGERMHKVYGDLLGRHDYAMLLGADAPQITAKILTKALNLASGGCFVLGPAADGGFYLLIGSQPIPLDLWLSVQYSSPHTRMELTERLKKIAPVKELETLTDVDELGDLIALKKELQECNKLTPSQSQMIPWLDQ